MRILDRYVLTSVVAVFVAVFFSFVFLYVVIDVIAHLEDIVRHATTLEVLGRYYLCFLPIIFVQVAPFSCLLATLYTFAKLNRANEVIAMRAAGLSILQITKGVLVFGFIVSLFVFWINDRYVPAAVATTLKFKEEMESGSQQRHHPPPQGMLKYLSMYGMNNRLYFVNAFSPSDNTMYGIVILENDRHQNVTKKIMANKGVWKDGVWTFYECVTYELDENGQLKDQLRYLPEEVMTIPEKPQDFLSQRQLPDAMTIAQLRDYIRKLKPSGAVTVIRSLDVELYRKFTDPLTSFLIILLGIPFSLRVKRRAAGLASLGLSIIVGFIYYVLSAVGIALGKGGILPPLASVSLSHTAVVVASLYLMGKLG